jgi:hypothetical protein
LKPNDKVRLHAATRERYSFLEKRVQEVSNMERLAGLSDDLLADVEERVRGRRSHVFRSPRRLHCQQAIK